MKELNIEEKAKAYDEAIEKLRNAFYDNSSRMCDEYRDACKRIIEPIFPELKESGDKRMKNFISNELACLRAVDEKGTARYNELTEAIAWLEKQGEQKQNASIQINPAEYINDMGGNGCYLKNTVQSSTWTKGDEEMLSNIVDCIKNLPIFYESLNINGEDKTTERFICDAINWLKSLKDMHTWKPSEEQMDTLEQWLKDNQYKGDARYCYSIIDSLYQGLKKLR